MDSQRNYKLNHYIGHGSFGKVYCVEDSKGRSYAMKEINWTHLEDKEKRNMVSEISLQKCNNSPYIIRYYDSYIENDFLYIISEYAEHGDMTSYRNKYPERITDEFIAKTLVHISLGLSYLHKNNIVHRDIKPSNILVTQHGHIRIGDLGVSKFFPESNLLDSLNGSPVCMSPEMCGGTGYNEKTDLWSLGCIIYYLLRGKYPYSGENILQLYYKITSESYEAIQPEDSIFYNEWNDILAKLLDKNPFTRHRASIICQEPFLLRLTKYGLETIQKKLHATNTIGENIWELYNSILSKKNNYNEEELKSIVSQINNYCPKRTVELDGHSTPIQGPSIPHLRLSPLLYSSTPRGSPSTTSLSQKRSSLPPLTLPPIHSTPRIESQRKKGSIFYEYKRNEEE